MIALDTNILVYAHREDSTHHAAARSVVEGLAHGDDRFAIPWPCVHEFLAIATHPRIYAPPSGTDVALAAVRALAGLPHAVTIGEASDHVERLTTLLTAGRIQGPKVHDARVAAICLANGVSELWTTDRDFSFFPALKTRNPLIA